MKLVSPKVRNPGDRSEIKAEKHVENVSFNVFKFNNRPKPADPKNVLIICCFSEFGCEIVGSLYCIPELLRKNPGKYVIVVGWYGREYLYRHLVDEFWEIKEDFMWLREYARAFHNESKNLQRIEKSLKIHGAVATSDYLGRIAVGARCLDCGFFWGTTKKVDKCARCESLNVKSSLFGDINYHKENSLVKIPKPSLDKQNYVKKYLGKNPVGIFARNRKCYGRNLQPDFYVGLIKLLEEKGYSPIWLGEKQSTLPCPVDHIVDFSRNEESRDLELTLAIVSQLKFTVQFWTASTRLAALMGTPYILFESPDQIWGNGQEGFRINLCSFGPKKIAICHYLNVLEDNQTGLNLVDRCVDELMAGNEDFIFGMIDSLEAAEYLKSSNYERIGG